MPRRPAKKRASGRARAPAELLNGYRAIFNGTLEFTALLTPDGTILELNQTALEFTGVKLEDVRGLPLWQAPWWSSDELRAWAREAVERASRGEVVRRTLESRPSNHEAVILDMSVQAVRDQTGNVELLIIEAHDISELVRTREALREREERLRLALDDAQMGVWDRDVAQGRLVWDARHEALFGFAPGSFDGRHETYLERVHPEDRGLLEQARQAARAGTPEVALEYRVVWPDGSVHWIASRGKAHLDEHGQIKRTYGVVMDVTGQKQAEAEREHLLERLALERSRFESTLEHLPIGVIVWDPATRRIAYANAKLERLLGHTIEPGQVFARLGIKIYQNGQPFVPGEGPLARAVEGRESLNGLELEIERADGSRLPVRVSTGTIRDRHGQPVAPVFAVEDMSEHRHAQARVQRLEGAIGRARDALGFFQGETVTPEKFVEYMGDLYHRTGQTQLEGRLVGFLLLSPEPVSLTEAADALGVSKVAVSKLTNQMLERGDLTMSREFSTRKHKFQLTDSVYVRDLSARRVASWAVSLLVDQMLETAPTLEPKVAEHLRAHLETHARTAVSLEGILGPLERRQARAFREHLERDWDAIPPSHLDQHEP